MPTAAAPLPVRTHIPAVIDIEASGFGAHSYPIEVGCVLPNGETFCSLIRPTVDWTHWDPAAEKVHRISVDILLAHGRAVGDVAALLNDRLDGETVYSDAWLHDYTWLAALFEAAGRVQRFRLQDLRSLLSEDEAGRWDATRAVVAGEMHLQRHRASADARVLQQTLRRLRATA